MWYQNHSEETVSAPVYRYIKRGGRLEKKASITAFFTFNRGQSFF